MFLISVYLSLVKWRPWPIAGYKTSLMQRRLCGEIDHVTCTVPWLARRTFTEIHSGRIGRIGPNGLHFPTIDGYLCSSSVLALGNSKCQDFYRLSHNLRAWPSIFSANRPIEISSHKSKQLSLSLPDSDLRSPPRGTVEKRESIIFIKVFEYIFSESLSQLLFLSCFSTAQCVHWAVR